MIKLLKLGKVGPYKSGEKMKKLTFDVIDFANLAEQVNTIHAKVSKLEKMVVCPHKNRTSKIDDEGFVWSITCDACGINLYRPRP